MTTIAVACAGVSGRTQLDAFCNRSTAYAGVTLLSAVAAQGAEFWAVRSAG